MLVLEVFAFYCTKLLGIKQDFPEPIPELVEGKEDMFRFHVSGCECESCQGYKYILKYNDLYSHFTKCLSEVLLQDGNRYQMPSDKLANLVLEYILKNNNN